MVEVCGSSLHSKEHGGQVRSDDLLKRGERSLADGRCAGDTGIGESDVDFAKLLYGFCNRAFGRFDIRYICLNGQQTTPEVRSRRVQALLVTPGNGNAGALCQKKACGGQANAAVT